MKDVPSAALPNAGRMGTQTASASAPLSGYRPDIDGLRAVAVLSVVIFHFFPSTLPGGFVGVDIFFVISGYLISRIIMSELEDNAFSFAAFYARRVRRIFPALIVVLSASLAFGWVALLRAEYARLGEHVTAGAAFVSNLLLWSESGYFDAAAIAKPLLHLWSLGIEEQFYIFWPVLLCLTWRLRLSLVLAIGVAVVSFVASLIATATDQVAAFYSPFNRFWELMLGAMMAHRELRNWPLRLRAEHSRLASMASFVGCVLIFLGLVSAREDGFPGWQALLPTAGTVLVIFAGPHTAFNRIALSSAPMVGLGLISYPLYLWHWPLLSFSRIVHGELGSEMRLALLSIAIILATLTFLFVERPLKASRHRAAMALLLVVLMMAAAGGGMLVSMHNGLEHRAVVRSNESLEPTHRHPPFTRTCPFISEDQKHLFQCYVDTREPPRFALLGDSKAGALFPGLFRTSRPGGTWMFIGSGSSGPLVPVLSEDAIYRYIDARAVDTALRTIEQTKSVETVVIATATRALFALANDYSIADLPTSRNYEPALKGLEASISRLAAAGKKIILLVDNPTLPYMEDCIDRRTSSSFFNQLLAASPNPNCQIPVRRHLELSRSYRDLLNVLQQRHPTTVSLFDTIPIMCDEKIGICTPFRNGRPLYGVTDHISDHASGLIGRQLNMQLHPDSHVRGRKHLVGKGPIDVGYEFFGSVQKGRRFGSLTVADILATPVPPQRAARGASEPASWHS